MSTTLDDERAAAAAGDPPRRPASRRRDAAIFRAVALAGVVVVVFAGTAAWGFLADLDRDLGRSLLIGEEAATTLADTIDVADRVVADLDQSLVTLEQTLDTLAATSDGTGSVAATAADVAARLPDSFQDVDRALATVESVATTIDDSLTLASRLPLGPDYDPVRPLPDAVADLRTAFVPVGDDLARLAERLDAVGTDAELLATDLASVRADVERTRGSLRASSRLLDRYRTTATDAVDLARTSRTDLDRSFALVRIGVVLLVAFGVVVQYVPWWLARRLDEVAPGGGADLSPTAGD